MHKLWFDCETAGLHYKVNPLLTAFFAITDDTLDVKDELYLQLKPDDIDKYIITAKALKTNNINLEDHLNDPQTLSYEEGGKKLLEFLNKHKIKGKRHHFRPCGHNIVSFDNDYIWEYLMPRDQWEKITHYNSLDTTEIVTFLKDTELLPSDVGTLTSLVEYFKIPMKEAHHAKGDVLMNIEVYRAIKSMMMNARKNALDNTANSSLLDIIER